MNLLAGDLGGTKTILAIYSNDNYPKKLFEKYYISSEWKSFYSLFEDFIKHLPAHISLPQYGSIGVAGPIQNQKVKITNLGWDIESKKLSLLSKINNIELINENFIKHKLTHLQIQSRFWKISDAPKIKGGLYVDNFEKYPMSRLMHKFFEKYNSKLSLISV